MLSPYPSAGGSSTTLMRQRRGHRVHWPLSGRPTGTTHRGTPVRWPPGPRLRNSWWNREETNRPRPGLPRSPLCRTFMHESVSRARAERQRQSARGSRRAGVRKTSCCYGNGGQRRTRAMCQVGAGGTLLVSLEAASRPLHLHHHCARGAAGSARTGSAEHAGEKKAQCK